MLREDKVINNSVRTLRRNRPVSGPWEPRTHARLFWQQRSGWGAGTKSEALSTEREPDKKVRAWICHEFLTYFQHGPTGASCKWLLQLCGSVSFPGCFVRNSGLLVFNWLKNTDLIWFFYSQSSKLYIKWLISLPCVDVKGEKAATIKQ